MDNKQMQSVIKNADKVFNVDSDHVPNWVSGMLKRILPSMLNTYGYYAVVIDGEKVCFVKA